MELVRDIHKCHAKQVIVSIARALEIRVIGEGVETEDELTVLRAGGISLFQGYLFAKPALMALPEVPMLAQSQAVNISTA